MSKKIEEKYIYNALKICGLEEEIIEDMLTVFRKYMEHGIHHKDVEKGLRRVERKG